MTLPNDQSLSRRYCLAHHAHRPNERERILLVDERADEDYELRDLSSYAERRERLAGRRLRLAVRLDSPGNDLDASEIEPAVTHGVGGGLRNRDRCGNLSVFPACRGVVARRTGQVPRDDETRAGTSNRHGSERERVRRLRV